MKTITQTATTADKIAMALGGGLVLLGTLVMGTLETLLGGPNALPVTNEAGVVVAETTFDPVLRATIVLAGLVVFGLFALYRLVATRVAETRAPATEQPAD